MNEIKLSLELVNAVMNYLGQKPYVETHALIAEIQRQAGSQVPVAEPTTTVAKDEAVTPDPAVV